jgi:carboxyl-terminal processing protease
MDVLDRKHAESPQLMPAISMSGCPDTKLTVVRNANQLHPGLMGIKGERGMPLKRWLGMLGLVIAALSGMRAEAEPRIALVIGNANYAGDLLPPLRNPLSDAKLMAETLTKAGFQVLMLADADGKQMKRALVDFGDKVANAGFGTTAAFYYVGHGVEVGGRGYMIPIGAEIARESDVEIEAVRVEDVVDQLVFAGSKVSILMLDAGRNNRLARGMRLNQGMAELSLLSEGMFVSYATIPGNSAADGQGQNGPYAVAASKAILTPGLNIHEVFEQVRRDVLAATSHQTTADTSTLDAPFYFLPKN